MSIRRMIAVMLGALVALLVLVPAAHADVTIADAALEDARGIAADPDRGVYWVAQSATSSAITAVGTDGQTIGQVTFDATPQTIESLSYALGHLYVMDIGDDASSRESITVFRLEDSQIGTSAPYSQWTLYYPDGPHPAKAALVSEKGNIYVVTFDAPGGIYLAETSQLVSGDVQMQRVADAPNWVTDAVFISDSDAAMRSYTDVSMVNMYDFSVWARAAAPAQPRGETMTRWGDTLVLGSRGSLVLSEMAVPEALDDTVPPASETPPGVAEESPSPSPTEESEEEEPKTDESTPVRKSVIGIGVALVLSVAAGITAYRVPGHRRHR